MSLNLCAAPHNKTRNLVKYLLNNLPGELGSQLLFTVSILEWLNFTVEIFTMGFATYCKTLVDPNNGLFWFYPAVTKVEKKSFDSCQN